MLKLLFYQPIYNLLIVFYNIFGSFGIAIILVALFSRLITYPLTRRQIQSAEKNKEFQSRIKALKKKHKNNQDQLTKEMAKVQAEFLPGQLGGCLNLIITIVFLFQIRNVVIDLFNKGVHSFNEVAYIESLKFPEDSLTVDLPEEFAYGLHELNIQVEATNGSQTHTKFNFALSESENERGRYEQEIKDKLNALSAEEKQKIQDEARVAQTAMYIEDISKSPVIIGRPDTLTIYFRPPSGETIKYQEVQVSLDGENITSENLSYSEGERLAFDFLGADLSKVASDFNLRDFSTVAPYVVIAVSVGITQFFATQIQTGAMGGSSKKAEKKPEKDSKKKKTKDDKTEQPDFAELMAESSKQMAYIFPFMTILISMGYLGGGNLFPSGVSLFWTGQNTFVIIQQLVMHREKVKLQLQTAWSKFRNIIQNGRNQNN